VHCGATVAGATVATHL